MNTYPNITRKKMALHSNMTTARPEAAPVPAIPTKLMLPMLLAKSDIPIGHQVIERPPRTKLSKLFLVLHIVHTPMPSVPA